jgi:hypothetical protein
MFDSRTSPEIRRPIPSITREIGDVLGIREQHQEHHAPTSTAGCAAKGARKPPRPFIQATAVVIGDFRDLPN